MHKMPFMFKKINWNSENILFLEIMQICFINASLFIGICLEF